MITFRELCDAYVAQKNTGDRSGELGRLAFWLAHLGDQDITTITEDHIHAGMVKLTKRGRLAAGRNTRTRKTDKPLKGSTKNRYLAQIGSLYKFAKDEMYVKRGFVVPSDGLKRATENADPDRYLRPDQVAKLIAVARAKDRQWRKMPALITVGFHTGLRVGSLMQLRARYLDLQAKTITVNVTKNGDPIVAALSDDAVAELKKLGRMQPDDLVFGSKRGKPFIYRKLFNEIAAAAGLEGKTFHYLRHGHGYMLAKSGVSQQMIMKSMGHRTLRASERYAHANIDDKRAVIAAVFNANPSRSPLNPPPTGTGAQRERPKLRVVA